MGKWGWLLAGGIVLFLLPGGSRGQDVNSPMPCATVEVRGSRTSYHGCSFPALEQRGEEGAREFLKTKAEALGISQDLSDLVVIDVKTGLTATTTVLQQSLEGHPVYGAYITVTQRKDGTIRSFHTAYRSQARKSGPTTPQLTASEAMQLGASAVGAVSLRSPSTADLIWFPQPDGAVSLAWQLMVESRDPIGSFLVLLDADGGEVLLKENRVIR